MPIVVVAALLRDRAGLAAYAELGLHHLALAVVDQIGLDTLYKRVVSWPGAAVEFGPESSGAGPEIHFIVREPSGVRIEFTFDPRLEEARNA